MTASEQKSKSFKQLLKENPDWYGLHIDKKAFESLTANRAKEWLTHFLAEEGIEVETWDYKRNTGKNDVPYSQAMEYTFAKGRDRGMEIPYLNILKTTATIPIAINCEVYSAFKSYMEARNVSLEG